MKKKMPKIQVVTTGGAPVSTLKSGNRDAAIKTMNSRRKAKPQGDCDYQ